MTEIDGCHFHHNEFHGIRCDFDGTPSGHLSPSNMIDYKIGLILTFSKQSTDKVARMKCQR